MAQQLHQHQQMPPAMRAGKGAKLDFFVMSVTEDAQKDKPQLRESGSSWLSELWAL